MEYETEFPELREAQARVIALRQSLPTEISAASLGVKSKAPYLLLWAREALIWRTEELGRNACDALERDDLATGILLVRAVTENAAFSWRLLELLNARSKMSVEELHETLKKMLLGWRSDETLPQAFNVLTLIDRIDKTVPGIRSHYDTLSEFAHPNWSGVAGLFSLTNTKEYTTKFGRGLRDNNDKKDLAAKLLLGALQVFTFAYNEISIGLEAFVKELEPLC